jgi:hypothetical protein
MRSGSIDVEKVLCRRGVAFVMTIRATLELQTARSDVTRTRAFE